MRDARHGATGMLLAAGALALVLAGCAQGAESGGSSDAGPATPSPTATPEPSATPEPTATPSPGRQEASRMEVVAGATGRGLPDGVEGSQDSPAGAAWSAGDGMLYVVTYGSSSCPTIAEAQAAADGEGIAVTFVPQPADAICTMDWSPTTTVVGVPDGADSGRPVTVRLGDLGTVEVPPRAHAGEAGEAAWTVAS